MNLEEWNHIDSTEEMKIICDQILYENIAKLAAIEFLKQEHYHAEGIYIGNKHGKLFFYVIVNPDVYSRQINKFINKEHFFYKFNYIISTLETLPFTNDIKELEKYEGINYFGKNNVINKA